MSMELGPYTNFHELNLDWFLNEFNKVLGEWEGMQKSFRDLNAAFSDLRNYVYDYFKNLDVQKEIDKKLDEMANDGSLYAIIRKYTDPIVDEQNSKITVLENRMNTFTSLPEGSTTGDAELIDIRVPAAGFNGNATYTSAGDAVRGQVSELKVDLDNIEKECLSVNVNAKPTLVEGKFVNATNNNIASNDSFTLTEPIPVKKGQIVKLTATGYNNVVGMICVCNSDNTERSTVVNSIDTNEHDYIYHVLNDGYVCCSFNKNARHRLSILIDYYEDCYSSIDTLNESLEIIYAGNKSITPIIAENGKFIDASTNNVSTSSNFAITDTIRLYKGQKIIVNAAGYLNKVGMINLYDSNKNIYVCLVRSIDNTVRDYEYIASENCNIRLSYYKYIDASVTVVTNATTSVRLDDIESKIPPVVSYDNYFDKCVCIGDSLTYGMQDNVVRLKTNYPYYFTKITGTETANKGHSGWTAKQVWDDDISSWGNASDYDLAIIYLGTNGGLTDTVSTDCNTDYTQNADTNTGCYGKIIGKLKADNPNIKIFIVAGANEYIRRADTMNVAVRKLASFYGVELIDLENSILSDDGSANSDSRRIYRPKDGIHYDRRGYLTLASLIVEVIKNTVKENKGWKFIY